METNKTEIKRWRSKKKFAGANWVVRVKTGKPQTMGDGSSWDGWETVGHFKSIKDARAAEAEAERRE